MSVNKNTRKQSNIIVDNKNLTPSKVKLSKYEI